jgi:hypothetical protein
MRKQIGDDEPDRQQDADDRDVAPPVGLGLVGDQVGWSDLPPPLPPLPFPPAGRAWALFLADDDFAID